MMAYTEDVALGAADELPRLNPAQLRVLKVGLGVLCSFFLGGGGEEEEEEEDEDNDAPDVLDKAQRKRVMRTFGEAGVVAQIVALHACSSALLQYTPGGTL